jgi:drug/metabolite transporter (DMT)-like permease
MRPTGIAGIILIVFGAFVLLRGGSFTTKRDVLRVGDVKVTADEQQTIPGWAGVLSIVAGVVLLVTGSKKRA